MYLFVCPSLVLDTKHGRPKCYTWLERSFRPDVQRKKLIDFGSRNGLLLLKKLFPYLRRFERVEEGRKSGWIEWWFVYKLWRVFITD